MVKATLIEPDKPTIMLEMSWDVDEVLSMVVNNIAGRTDGPRGKMDQIACSLEGLDISHDSHDYEYTYMSIEWAK